MSLYPTTHQGVIYEFFQSIDQFHTQKNPLFILNQSHGRGRRYNRPQALARARGGDADHVCAVVARPMDLLQEAHTWLDDAHGSLEREGVLH